MLPGSGLAVPRQWLRLWPRSGVTRSFLQTSVCGPGPTADIRAGRSVASQETDVWHSGNHPLQDAGGPPLGRLPRGPSTCLSAPSTSPPPTLRASAGPPTGLGGRLGVLLPLGHCNWLSLTPLAQPRLLLGQLGLGVSSWEIPGRAGG